MSLYMIYAIYHCKISIVIISITPVIPDCKMACFEFHHFLEIFLVARVKNKLFSNAMFQPFITSHSAALFSLQKRLLHPLCDSII